MNDDIEDSDKNRVRNSHQGVCSVGRLTVANPSLSAWPSSASGSSSLSHIPNADPPSPGAETQCGSSDATLELLAMYQLYSGAAGKGRGWRWGTLDAGK